MGRLVTLKPKVAQADLRTSLPPPKVADGFYKTKEWLSARDECLLRARFRCAKCTRVGGRQFADHKVEIKDGGAPLDQSNLQALCGSCHSTKTAAVRAERVRCPNMGMGGPILGRLPPLDRA